MTPRYTLSATNPAEWLALLMFLVTAMVVSRLTHLLRLRAGEARQRELETAALSRVSLSVASQISSRQTLEEVLRQTAHVIHSPVAAILTRVENGELEVVSLPRAHSQLPDFSTGQEADILGWVWANGRAVPSSEAPFEPEVSAQFLPLLMDGRVLGALYLWRPELEPLGHSQTQVVESLANQAAIALERERQSHKQAATEALLEADKLKSALLSMVSHDFRSPLAAIKASVTGLLQEGVPWDEAEQRELLCGINAETDRLNRMVGDILALSRLEADAWRPKREAASLAEVVGAALDAFSDQENCRIRVEIEPGLPEVALDSVQIVQVLHNLLENALKYSPPASTVELVVRAENGAIHLEVRDRGDGLPPGEETQIFQKFYRAKRWRESALPGTGIGLAICLGLVEAHGGTLAARNRDGGGAVFRVQLPMEEATTGRIDNRASKSV